MRYVTILVLLGLLSAVSSSQIVEQVPGNPGFEQGALGETPPDWLVPKVNGYKTTISEEAPAAGEQCATTVSTSESDRSPFGNLMQMVDAAQFRGQRVRLRAAVRAEVTGRGNQAQMWFRVDRRDDEGTRQMGAFDNMMNRPITSDQWQHFEIVGDVDDDAERIALGVFLTGQGQVWVDDVSLEIVDENVAVTARRPGGERGVTSLDDTKPGLFEIVTSYRLTPSALPWASLRDIVGSITGDPLPPQTVLMPLPLSYRDQVPLSFHLNVNPPGAVRSLDVYQDRGENYVLKLVIDDLRKWKQVDIEYTSTILVGPSAFDSVPDSAPLSESWPDEAEPWLAATWCADSKHDRIQTLAKEIRSETDDVREIIRRVESKTSQIFRTAEGHVTNLTAVEALDKQGSCTSRANLVAALLRASGVPARVLAGYPSWSGPLQTHYIVEAYVPEYGWYPIESTISQSPWPNTHQVNVAILPPEYEAEEKAGMRFGIAGGVPYLSLTELPGNSGAVVARGMVDSARSCDHECRAIRGLTGTPDEWVQAFGWAKPRWQEWLATDHKDSHGRLSFGRKSEDISATTVSALAAELDD